MYYFLTIMVFLVHLNAVYAGAEPGIEVLPTDYMVLHSLEGTTFSAVREDLELAITDRGMVVNNVSHIGNMLARTREAVGSGKQIFAQAEALEFCSSVISRNMMEANPHNIVFCPYIISVYTLPDQPERVYIAYRRPLPVGTVPSQKALLAVDSLLQSIVADVIK
ncbi:MAG: DUF302 domain-containing protein [Gammaproteobacteria bacterium]|nr:DUF302 domain-containing protein [Gammaproteobacteria bacterium]